MKQDSIERIIIYVLLGVGALALVVLGAWGGLRRLRNTQQETAVLPGDEPVTAVSEIPMICKQELVGLHRSVEKNGASGGLMLVSYEPEKDICNFEIRSMKRPGNFGTLKTLHQLGDGNYGITMDIDRSDEEQVRLWTLAVLDFFNKEIDGQTAAEAVEAILPGGEYRSELFFIRSRANAWIEGKTVTPAVIIELRLR